MKKTLVAIAALAAATGAMAQVTISGFVDAAVNTNAAKSSTGDKYTVTSLAPSGAGQSQITFSSSEDLGGGMTGYANLRAMPSAFAGTFAGDISEIGLTGDFGKIELGRGYGIDFGLHGVADASGWTSAAKGVVYNTSTATGTAVVYVLPEMVKGLGVLYARGVGGQGAKGVSNNYLVTYSSGPLYIGYAYGAGYNTGISTWNTNYATGGTTVTTDTLTEGTTNSQSGFAATYDFGVAKVHLGNFTHKSGSDADQKATSYMYGVSAPIGGAASVGITSSHAERADSVGTKASADGYRVKFSYGLSKRTKAYAAYGSEKASNSASNTETAIGLTHSF